jgi:hypothetical protein
VAKETEKERGSKMEKVKYFWGRYGTPRNVKIAYILLTLIALAVAGGAPGGTGGLPGMG